MPDLDLGGWAVYEKSGVVWVDVYVRNIGPGNAGRFLVEAVCAGRVLTSDIDIDSLPRGSVATIKFSLDDPPGADLVPQVSVDPRDELLESNEDNNVSPITDPLCGV
jgi:subtilase family serine protease